MAKDIRSNRKLAVLIDGDNAQPSLIDKILTECAKFGNITIRRVYGDCRFFTVLDNVVKRTHIFSSLFS